MKSNEVGWYRSKAYWTCQFLGWGVMFGYNMLIMACSNIQWPATWTCSYYGWLAFLGLLITHLCRVWFLGRIRSGDPLRLIGLTVFLGIVLGAIWTVLGDMLFQQAGLLPRSEDHAMGGLHYLRIALGGVLTMVTWFAFYFGARLLRTVHAAELARVKAEVALRDVHIRTLQARLRPHFLFNTLNSIHFLVDPMNDRARSAIAEFADLMRYHLEQRNDGETLVTRELEMLDSYIQLQQLRMDASVSVDQSVKGDLSRLTLPAFVCFNLVENAFKHLAPDATGRKVISIAIDVTRDRLQLGVGNTCGPRVMPVVEARHGLEDTRSTLELLRRGRHLLNLRHDVERQWFSAELAIELNADELPGR